MSILEHRRNDHRSEQEMTDGRSCRAQLDCSTLQRELFNEAVSSRSHGTQRASDRHQTNQRNADTDCNLPSLTIDDCSPGPTTDCSPAPTTDCGGPSQTIDCSPAPDTDCVPAPATEPISEPPDSPVEPPPSEGSEPIPPPGERDVPPERHPPFEGGEPIEGGRESVTIGDTIPPELQQYARMEGDTLVIDAQGNELPPLKIARDNVVVENARISASGQPGITVQGSNVQILNNEITGGTRGVLADGVSNVTVDGNYFHDFAWTQNADTTAVELDHVSGGVISNNTMTGNYRSDVISMYGTNNVKVMYNTVDASISEWSAAPFMVEGGPNPRESHDIEVAYNTFNYSGGVPPGLLGGYNLNGHDNVVNGDSTAGAWQLYEYVDNTSGESLWYNVFYDGQRYA